MSIPSWRWPPSLLRGRGPSAIRHGLELAVFLLQLALHLKVGLSFALDPLLLVVSDHAGVHGRFVVLLPNVYKGDHANRTEARQGQRYL